MHESGVSMQDDMIRDDLKRFRKEYSKPVQFRLTIFMCHVVMFFTFRIGFLKIIPRNNYN